MKKKPKFVLRVATNEFVIADNKGVATLMQLLSDAMPVDADLYRGEITLLYLEDPLMMTALTEVKIQRIPPGVVWKRKTKEGEVVPMTYTAIDAPKPKPAKKPLRLAGGRKPLQLEF